jgi:hypothetical protein
MGQKRIAKRKMTMKMKMSKRKRKRKRKRKKGKTRWWSRLLCNNSWRTSPSCTGPSPLFG